MRKLTFSAIRAAMIMLTFACVVLMSVHRPADAHASSAAFTTLEFSKHATRMTYVLDERSAIELSGGDLDLNGSMDDYEFDAVKPMFERLLGDQLRLAVDGKTVAWTRTIGLKLVAQGSEKQAVLEVEFPPVAANASVSLTDDLYQGVTRFDYVNTLKIAKGKPGALEVLSGSNRTWTMRLSADEYKKLS